jgi:FdhD protein
MDAPYQPRVTAAQAELLREFTVIDESGERKRVRLPVERALTLYVDRQEVVTLMTLGQKPELLALGYLLTQGLVEGVAQVESITVDWDVSAAAVRLRDDAPSLLRKLEHRIVTSGCGQGTTFADAAAAARRVRLPPPQRAKISAAALQTMGEQLRAMDSVHRQAGSVHGCALFSGEAMLMFVEDIGRHNAVDTIAGWMAQHGVRGDDKVLYTTGRLTTEMVMKAALIGVPIVVSRNGTTAAAMDLARDLGMALVGRAVGRRYLWYCGHERLAAPAQA